MNLNFKGTRLLVSDFNACINFYQHILGFELVYQDQDGEEADLKMGETRLNLIKRESMSKIIGTEDLDDENLTDNMALIFTTSDLDKTTQLLEEQKVKFISKPVYRPQWGIKTIYLRDPDQNLIGIYQMTDYLPV
ncbi:MAG: VOC family protein [Cyanobacteria bacterium J06631_6]